MYAYINRVPFCGPWGGGIHFINAVHNYFPENGYELLKPKQLIKTKTRPDLMMIAGFTAEDGELSAEQILEYRNYIKPHHRTKIILRINECDARKRTMHVDSYIRVLASKVDGCVFVSQWMHDYFVNKDWPCRHNKVIVNGVDPEVFHSYEREVKSDKIRIFSAHWSDNTMKGADVSEFVDKFCYERKDQYEFTYIGRCNVPFHKCTKRVEPIFGSALAKEMCQYDVCINGTKQDPGPNSVIEPIACGIPTYVRKEGGGAPEFAGADHVFDDFESLKTILLSKSFTPNSRKFVTWQDYVKQYIAFCDKIV